jgi:hypothetical protein
VRKAMRLTALLKEENLALLGEINVIMGRIEDVSKALGKPGVGGQERGLVSSAVCSLPVNYGEACFAAALHSPNRRFCSPPDFA